MYFITGTMKASHAHAPAAVRIAVLFLTRKPLKRVGSELERGSQGIWGRIFHFLGREHEGMVRWGFSSGAQSFSVRVLKFLNFFSFILHMITMNSSSLCDFDLMFPLFCTSL
jgi:hypothetical protein